MQREGGENCIKCVLFIWEELLIWKCFSSYRERVVEREVDVAVEEAWGRFSSGKMGEAVREGLRIRLRWVRIRVWQSKGARYIAGIGPKVKDERKLAVDVLLMRRLVDGHCGQ